MCLNGKNNVLMNAGLRYSGFELMGREDQNEYLKFTENEKTNLLRKRIKVVKFLKKMCYSKSNCFNLVSLQTAAIIVK